MPRHLEYKIIPLGHRLQQQFEFEVLHQLLGVGGQLCRGPSVQHKRPVALHEKCFHGLSRSFSSA